MSKMENRIKARDQEGALLTYLMAGDPTPERSIEYALALEKGGADLIELGVPFSDPVADGPTIQAAGTRALESTRDLDVVLGIVGGIREESEIPLILMTYYNPILQFGETEFLEVCRERGVDGLIIPDLPIEEAGNYLQEAKRYSLRTPFLATPETGSERLDTIVDKATGFLYLVARYGTTGSQEEVGKVTTRTLRSVAPQVPEELPICIGFGLSTPDHVSEVIRAGADGAIVGSAIVDLIGEGKEPWEVESFVEELKEGTRI